MSVAEIMNELTALAYRLNSMRNHQATTEGLKTTAVLLEAAAILSTHPYAKPNDPLTLEELRELDGEPMWVEFLYNKAPRWMLVNTEDDDVQSVYTSADFESYGEQWLAYRRRPEEEKR